MDKNVNLYKNSAYLFDLDPRDSLIDDIPFYIEYAKKLKGHILDLGCGTGRVSIELAKAGFNVTGIDLSNYMLEIYKNKVMTLSKSLQNQITIVCENMASFNIENRFKLIIAPFGSFQVLTKDIEIQSCLKCIWKHLEDDGLFIINVFRPSRLIDDTWCSGEYILWERYDPQNEIYVKRVSINEKIDVERQIIYPKSTFEITDKEGNIEKYSDNMELKYYYYTQLKSILLENSFLVTEEYGWYDKSSIENGREMIMVCKKALPIA